MMEVHQFNVKSLEQTCFKVLKDSLCPKKCIGLWQFKKACYIPIFRQLKYEAFHFICENFEEVSLCEDFVKDFLQLEEQEVADILGQDNLSVTKESTVYQSVLRWINHMPEERQGAIATLLPKVRLGLMDKSYITDNVLNNDLVQKNPESHLLVSKTLQVMSQPSLLCSEPGINNTLFCRRLPNAVLLMVGLSFRTIEAFDYSTNDWITVHTQSDNLEESMTNLFFYSTDFLDRCLYIVGGGLKWLVPTNRVWRFNLVTHTWQEVSPMAECRAVLSVTVLKGCIYAMGGCGDEDHTVLRTAERYQPEINQWTFIASMNEGRCKASCTTLNNKIYICGGRKDYRDLNTAECYNPDTNQWTLITPMGTPRYGLGVVAYMDHVFAVGGYYDTYEDSIKLRSVEAYDPVTNTWHEVPKMAHGHYRFGITVMNKKIFVVSCSMKEKKVECYDYTTNTWSVVFSGMDSRDFDYVKCCVMSGLPNMAEYCSPREPVIPRTQC